MLSAAQYSWNGEELNTFPICKTETFSPNFGATVTVREIVAERFNLRVEKSVILNIQYGTYKLGPFVESALRHLSPSLYAPYCICRVECRMIFSKHDEGLQNVKMIPVLQSGDEKEQKKIKLTWNDFWDLSGRRVYCFL